MSDTNMMKFSTVEAGPNTPLAFRVLQHGDDLAGLNLIAHMEGKLCAIACDWCYDLCKRIESRTAMQLQHRYATTIRMTNFQYAGSFTEYLDKRIKAESSCPTCHVGRGSPCRDLDHKAEPDLSGFHPERMMVWEKTA